MPTAPENVCSLGNTGSHRLSGKPTRLTPNRHAAFAASLFATRKAVDDRYRLLSSRHGASSAQYCIRFRSSHWPGQSSAPRKRAFDRLDEALEQSVETISCRPCFIAKCQMTVFRCKLCPELLDHRLRGRKLP